MNVIQSVTHAPYVELAQARVPLDMDVRPLVLSLLATCWTCAALCIPIPLLVTCAPTAVPTSAPSASPTGVPSASPSHVPSGAPSASPLGAPSALPTRLPTAAPTGWPSHAPSSAPTGWLAGVPHASHLRAHASFGATGPLDDDSGHGNHLATVDARSVSADCSHPPCFVRLVPGAGSGLVAPVGVGQSANGTTVCVRYRVWGPADGTGAILALSPMDDNAPSKGSVKYYGSGSVLNTWTVSDSTQLFDSWAVAPAANSSSPHTHVCLSWFLHGPTGHLRHRLVVDNTTFPLLCPGGGACADESAVPMVGAETVMCIGCVGDPGADRQTDMDVSMFAVWDTALSPEETRAYIDLAATAP